MLLHNFERLELPKATLGGPTPLFKALPRVSYHMSHTAHMYHFQPHFGPRSVPRWNQLLVVYVGVEPCGVRVCNPYPRTTSMSSWPGFVQHLGGTFHIKGPM